MNEQQRYDPTWRDDAELDAFLLAGKVIGLANIESALGIKAGHRAILADGAKELRD
jgi:hypothetical protein